jgi:hypothetical protein
MHADNVPQKYHLLTSNGEFTVVAHIRLLNPPVSAQ